MQTDCAAFPKLIRESFVFQSTPQSTSASWNTLQESLIQFKPSHLAYACLVLARGICHNQANLPRLRFHCCVFRLIILLWILVVCTIKSQTFPKTLNPQAPKKHMPHLFSGSKLSPGMIPASFGGLSFMIGGTQNIPPIFFNQSGSQCPSHSDLSPIFCPAHFLSSLMPGYGVQSCLQTCYYILQTQTDRRSQFQLREGL